ncbi:MAG: DUF4358 domain-containing protein [bacterium]|nr:DUF4358 domain-containing protein [bacterium]
MNIIYKKVSLISICICLLTLLAITLTSCGSHTSASSSAQNISLETLNQYITKEAGNLPEMSTYTSESQDAEDWFNYLCDFDYSKIDQYFISYSSSGSAEEIFLLKVKNEADVPYAVKALENRITARTSTFEMYLPAEVSKLSSGTVVSKGNYIALLICPDQYSAKKAFETNL